MAKAKEPKGKASKYNTVREEDVLDIPRSVWDDERKSLRLRKIHKGYKYPELDVVLSYAAFGISMTKLFSLLNASAEKGTGGVLDLSRPLATQVITLEDLLLSDLDVSNSNSMLANAAAHTIGRYEAAKKLAAKGSRQTGVTPYNDSHHSMQQWVQYNEPFANWWGALDAGFSKNQDAPNASWFPRNKGALYYVGRYIGAVPSIEHALYSAMEDIPKYLSGGAAAKKGYSSLRASVNAAKTMLDKSLLG